MVISTFQRLDYGTIKSDIELCELAFTNDLDISVLNNMSTVKISPNIFREMFYERTLVSKMEIKWLYIVILDYINQSLRVNGIKEIPVFCREVLIRLTHINYTEEIIPEAKFGDIVQIPETIFPLTIDSILIDSTEYKKTFSDGDNLGKILAQYEFHLRTIKEVIGAK